ncbi:MAG: glycosyltransferase family protein [Azoarcus sp.]|jgi:hypothetical protein|nr:glycosyltransferase family protein [Azoarcus sp.]
MTAPFFSIVVNSIDKWKFAQFSTHIETLFAGVPFEIVGIHDARSMTEGYNRGLKRARGNIIIFSHDDVVYLDRQFAQKIAERMQSWDVLGFAGTSRLTSPAWFAADFPHLHGAVSHCTSRYAGYLSFIIYGASSWPVVSHIEALDGLCIIARREVAESIGFDSETFDHWHLYDLDFSFAAYLAGFRIGVCCDIPILHASTSIQSLNSSSVMDVYQKYAERFRQKYEGRRPMMPFDRRSAQGTQCFLRSPETLVSLWTEKVFRRASLTVGHKHSESAA